MSVTSTRDNDSIENRYRTLPPLSHPEVCDLVRRWQQHGDYDARERLVAANIRFVMSVAAQYQNRGLELKDLVAEGNVGLLIAVDRFDAGRGWRFISYGVWWIRQSIIAALQRAHTVRQPVSSGTLAKQLHLGRRRMEQELGRTVSEREVLEQVLPEDEQESVEERFEQLISYQGAVSVDALVGLDQDRTWLEVSAGRRVGTAVDADVEERLMVQQQKDLLADLLHLVPARERRILGMYFGLDGRAPMTLEKIGKELGLTRERIRQLRNRALKTMRKHRDEIAQYIDVKPKAVNS